MNRLDSFDAPYPPVPPNSFPGQDDLTDRDAFCARVAGDSMEPKYHEGEIVTFSPSRGPHSGEDCFVRFADGQTTFKRVYFEHDKAGKQVIRLQPRNAKYRCLTVDAETVTGIWCAAFKYTRIDADPPKAAAK